MRAPVALALTAAALMGCGGSGGDRADPAAALPADAPVYLELVVDPEGAQKVKMSALAGRVLGTDEPGRRIVELLEKAGEGRGDFERDVEPWLGERAGVALTGSDGEEPSFVAAVASTDSDAASEVVEREAERDKAQRATYEDVEYFVAADGDVTAVAGDYVLFADSERVMRLAIDATGGPSLAESRRFKQAVEPLPGGRVGTIYVDVKRLVDQAGEIGAAEQQIVNAVLGGAPPTAVAVLAEEDHLALESRMKRGRAGSLLGRLSGFGSLGATTLLGEAPGDSWAAVGAPDLGRTVQELVRTLAGPLGGAVLGGQLEQELDISLERDVFSWIGDVALFARGGSVAEVDGGAVIAVKDAARARAAIPKLLGALRLQAGLELRPISLEGASLAFEVGDGTVPRPIVVALADERAVIAYGQGAAKAGLEPSSRLSDADVWDQAAAVLDGLEPSLVLDVSRVLPLSERAAGGEPGFAEFKPYLERLRVLAAGSERDGDEIRSRFAVGVTD